MKLDGGLQVLYEYLNFDPYDPCDGCEFIVDGYCVCCDGCAREGFPALPGAENRTVGTDSVI